MLGAKYNAFSEPVVTYDNQNTQYSGSIVVGTPSEKINVLLENHNFHQESKSSTYVPTATHSRSSIASIKCQVFYFAEVTEVSVQELRKLKPQVYNINA